MKYKFEKRCKKCGAEVKTNDRWRRCYKCESEMDIIKEDLK